MFMFIKYSHRPTDTLTNFSGHLGLYKYSTLYNFFLRTITNKISFRLQDNWIYETGQRYFLILFA